MEAAVCRQGTLPSRGVPKKVHYTGSNWRLSSVFTSKKGVKVAPRVTSLYPKFTECTYFFDTRGNSCLEPLRDFAARRVAERRKTPIVLASNSTARSKSLEYLSNATESCCRTVGASCSINVTSFDKSVIR